MPVTVLSHRFSGLLGLSPQRNIANGLYLHIAGDLIKGEHIHIGIKLRNHPAHIHPDHLACEQNGTVD